MSTTIQRWRFSVDDYAKMLESKILGEDDRVELIDGEVRPMSPIGRRHMFMVNNLNRILIRQVGNDGVVSVQNPLQLDDYTEPQPDLVVFKWREDLYRDLKAGAGDVLLVIEVADSSLEYDRNEKLPRYASARVPEVWIVDLNEDRPVIEQYSAPQAGHYENQTILKRGDLIVSVSLSSCIRIPVSDIFR